MMIDNVIRPVIYSVVPYSKFNCSIFNYFILCVYN